MKTVMCAGTFDVVHPGHLFYFGEAKKHGDKLVVVVARDSTTESVKGTKPSKTERERLDAVRSLSIVDEAILGNKGNIFDVIEKVKPDVICLGYDQHVQKAELEAELEKRHIKADVYRIGSHMPHVYKSSKMKK